MNTERNIYFYLANLGSEIQRMFLFKEKKDYTAMESCYNRTLPILEKIKSFKNSGANTEIDILAEVLLDLKSGGERFEIKKADMSSYFNPFALMITRNL